MNKKQQVQKILENYKKYHIQGCANYFRRPKNAIYIRPGNTIEHETEKLRICHTLQKEGHPFITESAENSTGLIRDIVDLLTGKIYEIELSSKRAERHKNNSNIIVVMV